MADSGDKITLPDGKVGTRVSVKSTTDNSAELMDGTIVRFKSIITDAVQLDEFDPDGNPVYVFQFGLVLSGIEVPPKLKRAKENEPQSGTISNR